MAPKRAHPLREDIRRVAKLDVLLLKREVQRAEVRAGDIPVVALRLHEQREGVGQGLLRGPR